jgi:excisionase family DNA binding protein
MAREEAMTDGPIAITVAEAAARLSVSTATMRRMVNSGAIDHCRPSPGTVRVLVASLERHVRATTAHGAMRNADHEFRHIRPGRRPAAGRPAPPSRP